MPGLLYLLKRFPRLSQTFALNELLELERQAPTSASSRARGADEALSHAAVARLRAPVEYLRAASRRRA